MLPNDGDQAHLHHSVVVFDESCFLSSRPAGRAFRFRMHTPPHHARLGLACKLSSRDWRCHMDESLHWRAPGSLEAHSSPTAGATARFGGGDDEPVLVATINGPVAAEMAKD